MKTIYNRKTVNKSKYQLSLFINFVVITILLFAAFQNFQLNNQTTHLTTQVQAQTEKEISIANQISSYVKHQSEFEKLLINKPVEYEQNIDTWVGKYVDQYYKTPGEQSEMRMVMHCLLNRESKHGIDKGHGDNGKAGGPLQFWEGTWDRMRGQMLKQGLIAEIGSRYNTEQAIHTTVWAFKNGNGLEWGPVLRWSNGRAYQHACPTPKGY